MLNRTATPRTDKVIRESYTAKLPVVLSMHAMGLEQELALCHKAIETALHFIAHQLNCPARAGNWPCTCGYDGAHFLLSSALRAGESIVSTKKEPHT